MKNKIKNKIKNEIKNEKNTHKNIFISQIIMDKTNIKYLQEIFSYVMEQSVNYQITKDEANHVFMIVNMDKIQPFYENRKILIDGIHYYTKLNEKINNVNTMDKLINLMRNYFVEETDKNILQNEFNMVQALMKICIHRIWQLCYDLHPRLRTTPEEAINDIIDPIKASQKIFREIMATQFNINEV